jgi:hypothetical protein
MTLPNRNPAENLLLLRAAQVARAAQAGQAGQPAGQQQPAPAQAVQANAVAAAAAAPINMEEFKMADEEAQPDQNPASNNNRHTAR